MNFREQPEKNLFGGSTLDAFRIINEFSINIIPCAA
jgi:hypothetical protein